ncbi:MAG: hypothetical protein IJS29_04130 [Selenomonadaceae bacterium]|nr:hypothetical protein [Selenomonadaceae bacterium]
MALKKFGLVAVMFAVMFLLSGNVSAMTFSRIVKIGEVGFPAQAPYHGFIVRGENYNSGTPYVEEFNYSDDGTPIKTYTKGTAIFDNLYCNYDFNLDFADKPIKFGGKNNYILGLDGSDKEIFKIENNGGIKLYVIYHNYCGTQLNILGTQKNGNWVNYIDSKKISENYFNSNEGYKKDGGIIYDVPTCRDDTIIIQYRRWYWNGESEPEGEFNFKWDDNAQRFNVEHIVY